MRKPQINADVPKRLDEIPKNGNLSNVERSTTSRPKLIRLNNGGMFFNARDRQIVLLVAAHGWLDKKQLQAFLGGEVSVDSLRQSIRRLINHGLLESKYSGFNAQSLYTSTAFGLRQVNAEGFRTGVTPRTQTFEHTDAITAISLYFTQLKNPNVIFLTERELNAAVRSGELSPRILTTAPWAQEYDLFENWIPRIVTQSGQESYKRPDGYILTCADGKAQLPIPVEVERTLKTRADSYEYAAVLFATAAKNQHIASTVMYFVPGAIKKNLIKLFKTIYASDGNWPASLPKVKFEVNDLDPLYYPLSARRGWIPSGAHQI